MFDTTNTRGGGQINMSVPLTKVDIERRTVHGFATLDNIDKQGDIVTKEASVDAFNSFRGNIREQHDPTKAVGKVVDFRTEKYWDATEEQVYEGIYVSAYVSKGAQDTWEKVVDGTLSGFSIGGSIKGHTEDYNEEADTLVRIVTDYELTELSLVDSPANQLANVMSVEKLDNGEIKINTPLAKGDLKTAFWCKKDGTIVLESNESANCTKCGDEMDNVGFVESGEPNADEVIKGLIMSKNKTAEEARNMEEVSEEQVEKSDASDETQEEVIEKTDSVEETEESSDEVVEKTDVVEEEVQVEKTDVVEDVPVVKSDEAVIVESVVESLSKMTDIIQALSDKVDGLSKSVGSVKTQVDSVKGDQEEFGKRVDKVEDTTAFRKSGDLSEIVQEQPVKKSSLWGGRFLDASTL